MHDDVLSLFTHQKHPMADTICTFTVMSVCRIVNQFFQSFKLQLRDKSIEQERCSRAPVNGRYLKRMSWLINSDASCGALMLLRAFS